MKKHILLASLLVISAAGTVSAQRAMDVLDRGLVAVKTSTGVFCSWRISGEEWYDVSYNIYRDGTKLNDTPLSVSNFTDPAGTESATYTVAAIVDGVEQAVCPAVTVLAKNYMTIQPKHDPTLTSTYVPNDACCADVDGDGVLEILMKYDNESEISASYPRDGHNGEYSLFECLKLDGTVLWWVNCGPNMGDFQNNEQNIVGYDWDLDGKAEVVFRAADGTKIHTADGSVYTVGDPSINYRAATGGGTNWFMHHGKEYLLYVNGETGQPYQCIDYPLPRLEDYENPNGLLSGSAYDDLVNKAWGDGYGHRSTKHFFGAPYLDGRHPSIFLARGIYTRHKMVAYDVNPATHELIERWRWNCSEGGDWFGQGYHNYSIADVDWDGRDEIVFGSMVIDDNGMGLSTTGLGHGDSHHVGDFDPYTHGQEVFACNEDSPNNNFRDATTSKIYYRTTGGNDDGRANCGNFIDEYPGAQALSSRDAALIGCASHAAIDGDNKSTVTITQNFRIYWDGDLCDESFDYSNGKNSQGGIYKAREGRIALLEGSKTNNDTKGTPCYQGDIFGDWREEVIMRDGSNNIRIYTTDIPTPWRNYTLWHDHQYRNAMVWQMCGYNQTPHVSYFIGEFEGITTPPAPVTMTGRTEIANNGTIGHDTDGKHIIMCETGDMTVTVADGAAPYILTVNAPTWVQGHNSNGRITTDTYTHTIEGGALTGKMRLVKQGDGILSMAKAEHTYTGATEIWAGELDFDGTLANSPLWLNRFARLHTSAGKFAKGIDMDYGSVLSIGNGEAASTVETDALALGFGSVVELDLFAAGAAADCIKANVLKIEKKDWKNGPEYLTPVIRLTGHFNEGETILPSAKYLIGEIGKVDGSLDDLIVLGIDNQKKTLVYEDGKLYLDVKSFETGAKTWMGTTDGVWDIDSSLNFVSTGSEDPIGFYPSDEVTFDDAAAITDITVSGTLMPKSVNFNNETKNYTLNGDGAIVGETSIVKAGAATLKINNVNQYTGGTYINGGTLVAATFANRVGTEYGSLGAVANPIYLRDGATLSGSANATVGHNISITENNGTIDTPNGVTLTLEKGITQSKPGQTLYKTGAGTLSLGTGNSVTKLVIMNGSVNATENSSSVIQLPATVEFVKGNLYDESNIYSYSTNPTKFVVAEGNSGALYLDARCDYTGTLTGGGKLTVYAASVRNYLKGNWSEFTGTVVAGQQKRGSSYDPDFIWSNDYGLPKATLSINAGTTFNPEGRSVEVGNLAGSGTFSTSGTITVGRIGNAFAFSGSFAGNPDIVKIGTGDWKMARALSGLKKITIKDGTLSLGASNYNANVCTTPIVLTDKALMRGRGTVTSITVNAGATLQPGYYSDSSPLHYGPMYTDEDLTVNEGATLALFIRKSDNAANSRSYVSVHGTLTINGVVKVELAEDYKPKAGDEIKLWTAGEFKGVPSEFDLPTLPEGLAWDYSDLQNANGQLRVIESSGITSIDVDCPVICEVYTAEGILCAEIETLRGDVVAAIRRMGLPKAVYIVKITSESATESVKIAL